MSNTVNTSQIGYNVDAADLTAGAAPAKPAPQSVSTAAAPSSPPAAEIVSLSSEAGTRTQLLDAARHAEGVDLATVQSLKSAVQNGTYEVSPDKLAQSIIGAMKEMT